MTNVEKLIDFITTLTPEEADKLICEMPQLLASFEASFPPAPQKAS